MRGTWTALTVAGALGVTLTACGSQRATPRAVRPWPTDAVDASTAHPAAAVVAWVDDPVPLPSPTPPPLPPGLALCSADQVTTRVHPSVKGITGVLAVQVYFEARAGMRCALRYGPRVTGDHADGTDEVLGKADRSGYENPIAIVSAADGSAYLQLGGPHACDAWRAGRHDLVYALHVTMPGGGIADIAVPGGFDAICGGISSYFTSDQPEKIPPARPLTATIDAPATIHAGEDLHYEVTLTNTSDQPFPLDPCPIYEDFVTTSSSTRLSATIAHVRLNCSTVTAIGPHESVTYAMQLRLPADQAPGGAKFGWGLETSYDRSITDAGASAQLTVLSG